MHVVIVSVTLSKALSTLATTVIGKFGDSRRFRRL